MSRSSPDPSAPLCPYCHAAVGGESDYDRRVLSPAAGGTFYSPLTAIICRSCRSILGFA
jgi:hypothetical protein